MTDTPVSYRDEMFRVDFTEHTGKPVMVNGQTEATHDLYDACKKADGKSEFDVQDVVIHGADTDTPHVYYTDAVASRAISGVSTNAAKRPEPDPAVRVLGSGR